MLSHFTSETHLSEPRSSDASSYTSERAQHIESYRKKVDKVRDHILGHTVACQAASENLQKCFDHLGQENQHITRCARIIDIGPQRIESLRAGIAAPLFVDNIPGARAIWRMFGKIRRFANDPAHIELMSKADVRNFRTVLQSSESQFQSFMRRFTELATTLTFESQQCARYNLLGQDTAKHMERALEWLVKFEMDEPGSAQKFLKLVKTSKSAILRAISLVHADLSTVSKQGYYLPRSELHIQARPVAREIVASLERVGSIRSGPLLSPCARALLKINFELSPYYSPIDSAMGAQAETVDSARGFKQHEIQMTLEKLVTQGFLRVEDAENISTILQEEREKVTRESQLSVSAAASSFTTVPQLDLHDDGNQSLIYSIAEENPEIASSLICNNPTLLKYPKGQVYRYVACCNQVLGQVQDCTELTSQVSIASRYIPDPTRFPQQFSTFDALAKTGFTLSRLQYIREIFSELEILGMNPGMTLVVLREGLPYPRPETTTFRGILHRLKSIYPDVDEFQSDIRQVLRNLRAFGLFEDNDDHFKLSENRKTQQLPDAIRNVLQWITEFPETAETPPTLLHYSPQGLIVEPDAAYRAALMHDVRQLSAKCLEAPAWLDKYPLLFCAVSEEAQKQLSSLVITQKGLFLAEADFDDTAAKLMRRMKKRCEALSVGQPQEQVSRKVVAKALLDAAGRVEVLAKISRNQLTPGYIIPWPLSGLDGTGTARVVTIIERPTELFPHDTRIIGRPDLLLSRAHGDRKFIKYYHVARVHLAEGEVFIRVHALQRFIERTRKMDAEGVDRSTISLPASLLKMVQLLESGRSIQLRRRLSAEVSRRDLALHTKFIQSGGWIFPIADDPFGKRCVATCYPMVGSIFDDS